MKDRYPIMKRHLTILLAAVSFLAMSCGNAQKTEDLTAEWKAFEQPLNFYLVNDTGRNGYYDQKDIAATMGRMAETIDIEFVVGAGDIHHFEGVRSVSDPLWMTNYELIYSHPDLMIPWYTICGNHEYRGNTQAPIDYSKVSARWNMPSKYYTFVKEEDGVTVRIVMVDTCPMIDKYREDTAKYGDASKEDYKAQLAIYAYTDKSESERTDLQERLDTIIRKYGNVDMYLCGHIHTFQHITKDGIDYVVNSSGSLSRDDVKPIDGTVFCSNKSGFSLVTASENELDLQMLDKDGHLLHTVTRRR